MNGGREEEGKKKGRKEKISYLKERHFELTVSVISVPSPLALGLQ